MRTSITMFGQAAYVVVSLEVAYPIEYGAKMSVNAPLLGYTAYVNYTATSAYGFKVIVAYLQGLIKLRVK